jgi:PAS domain S-box-containing protein
MAPDREEPARGLAGRLRRVGEVLIALSGSPVPTHLFQTLEEQTQAVVPHDYLAVCLEDVERRGYLVHSLSPLPGGAVSSRLFNRDEGLPGQAIRTGRALLVADLEAVPGAAADLDGALVRAGLRAALAVPVRRGLEVVGALLFARPGPAYDDEDLEVGTLLAAGLSAGLETCRAYQALADERSTLAAVLTSTADAVVMVGGDGLVLLANPGARAMLGLAPEAVIGRPLAEAIAHEPLRRLLEAGRPGIAELRLPDGRTAQASLVAVTTEYGEPVGLAAILRDITLLKELDQMKTDFVSTVSHDLKSPIMAIAMTAELLLKAAPAEPAHRERCERILRSARNMTDLVTDLLDLGKIEAGLEGAGEAVDLVPLIAEVVREQAAAAEAKRIAVAVGAGRGAGAGRAGPARPGPDEPDRQRAQVHRRGRAGCGHRRGGDSRRPARPAPRQRQRHRDPRAGPAARLRQVLPGEERRDHWHLRDRPRPGHHPEHRRGPRRTAGRGEPRGRR